MGKERAQKSMEKTEKQKGKEGGGKARISRKGKRLGYLVSGEKIKGKEKEPPELILWASKVDDGRKRTRIDLKRGKRGWKTG